MLSGRGGWRQTADWRWTAAACRNRVLKKFTCSNNNNVTVAYVYRAFAVFCALTGTRHDKHSTYTR